MPLCGDDTVDGHRGKKVYGKACHRDAVRSTHSFTAYRWGHQGVVPAILVKFPFAQGRWALTVAWYDGGTRRIEVVSGVGHGFKNGEGLVPLRWVFVHDLT